MKLTNEEKQALDTLRRNGWEVVLDEDTSFGDFYPGTREYVATSPREVQRISDGEIRWVRP